MGTIARLMVELGMNSSDFDAGVKGAAAASESFVNKLGNLGKGMSASVTLPILGAGAAALKFSTDFNASMAIWPPSLGRIPGTWPAVSTR